MNVAIVGSSGYIAGYLIKAFERNASIDKICKIDQTDEADLKLNLSEAERFDYSVLKDIDYVVFTAAISGPDKCANEFDLCWDINVNGTSYFINRAIESGSKVLFFSSDAVFGDIAGHIYTEDSPTEAKTPYGRMKKAVEDEFKGNPRFKAIRLSYVASVKDRFISYCLNCIKDGTEAEIFHPFYRNCITVSDVVTTVEWIISNWDNAPFMFLNVAGDELVSRVRMADELNRCFDNRLKYKIVEPNEKFYLNRPKITQMKSKYLNRYDIIKSSSFTEKIQNELKEIKL